MGNVHAVADGPSGCDAAERWQPHVAFIDVGLPGLDGYEVARRIRAGHAGRQIYLVALTGYGQPEDRRRAAESGFDEHFVKPIDSPQLQSLIWRASLVVASR